MEKLKISQFTSDFDLILHVQIALKIYPIMQEIVSERY